MPTTEYSILFDISDIQTTKYFIMYYEINVSNGTGHYFATHPRSLTTQDKAIEVAKEIIKRFPPSEGFKVMVSFERQSGTFTEIKPNSSDAAIVRAIKQLSKD